MRGKRRKGEERRGKKGRKGKEREGKRKKACMSSQAGSVRPLCHVSLPQPLHRHTHGRTRAHAHAQMHTCTHAHTHTHTHTHTHSFVLPRWSCSHCHSEPTLSHTLISPLSSCRIIRTKVQQQPGQTGSVSAHNLGRSLLLNPVSDCQSKFHRRDISV